VVVFAESFGARTGIAALHLLAMVVIAAASWRLAAVQARLGEQRTPAAREPRHPRSHSGAIPAAAQ
jgi:hypothetical protein